MTSKRRLLKPIDSFASYLHSHTDQVASRRFSDATRSLPAAAAFDRLHPRSLAIASARFTHQSKSINLLLPSLTVESMFAGPRTALEFGLRLADLLELPVRLVSITSTVSRRRRIALEDYLKAEFPTLASRISAIVSPTELPDTEFGARDLWVVTHWTTAHSTEVASQLGLIDPAQVTYLVQDYEPGFNPWSTAFALAKSTYHAGFRIVVNSIPVYDYLRDREGLVLDPSLVFRPQLDLARLEEAAELRSEPTREPRILFYARPDKPRNLFEIGMSTIAIIMTAHPHISVTTAGAAHGLPSRGPLSRLSRAGKTSWEDYFALLARSDMVLSLQYSPHPSHPPLDAIVSGGWAVTNELSGSRASLHPRLLVAEPHPRNLAEAVEEAISSMASAPRGGFSPEFIYKLGGEFDDVVRRLASGVLS